MKGRFTIEELSNHLVNQVIMADADMQLKQGAAWRELTKDTPLTAGGSHLNFLGMEEASLGFSVALHRPFWMRVVGVFAPKFAQKHQRLSLVSTAQSQFNVTIRVKRTIANRYEKEVDTNLPDDLKGKRVGV